MNMAANRSFGYIIWLLWIYAGIVDGIVTSGTPADSNCVSGRTLKKKLTELENFVVDISCAADGKIADLNLTSGVTSDACTNPDCCGLSSDLLVAMLNCHWKTNCTIPFPKGRIVNSDDGRCFGQSPSFLHVKSWECLPAERALVDFCAGSDSPILAPTSGIIRSHPRFPWTYEPKDKNCTKKIYFNSNIGSLRYLIVTVKVADIGSNDSISVQAINSTNPASEKEKDLTSSDSRTYRMDQADGISLRWNMSSSTLNGGEGVLICFAFTNETVKDACAKVMTTRSDVEPRQLESSKRKPVTEESSCYQTKKGDKKIRKNKKKKGKGKDKDKNKNKKGKRKNRKNKRRGRGKKRQEEDDK